MHGLPGTDKKLYIQYGYGSPGQDKAVIDTNQSCATGEAPLSWKSWRGKFGELWGARRHATFQSRV